MPIEAIPDSNPHPTVSMDALTASECWDLIGAAPLGRIGLVVDGRPEVLPVNFAVDGTTILFRTAPGTVLNASSLAVVAFEVDHFDEPTRTGWSVMVQGFARDFGADTSALERAGVSIDPWVPGQRDRWFRIEPDRVTGRRLSQGSAR